MLTLRSAGPRLFVMPSIRIWPEVGALEVMRSSVVLPQPQRAPSR